MGPSFAPSLRSDMEDPANQDALFHVVLYMVLNTDTWTFEGKTLDQWKNSSILVYYQREYESWRLTVYPGLDAYMAKQEASGEPSAQGWEKHDVDALFDRYWSEHQNAEVQEIYKQANESFLKAKRVYNDWLFSPEFKAQLTESIHKEECDLVSLGYRVTLKDNGEIEGYLTAEQLATLPHRDDLLISVGWAATPDSTDGGT